MWYNYFSKRRLIWVVLLCFLPITNLTLVVDADSAEIQGVAIEQFAEHLNTQIPIMLEKSKIEGVSIAIVQNGAVVFSEGYGVRDESLKLPVESDTLFQMASISKTFAAWGIMKLVQEGKIELDAPVDTYLTRWKLPTSKFDHSGVTIRRLLSHTAGTSLSGYPGLNPRTALPTIEESLNGKTGGAGKVFVKYEPGMQFMYSGGGYTILQLVIEEVTGLTFEEYMAQEVLQPLGMSQSTFRYADVNKDRLAKGYDAWGNDLPNYLFTAKAAAGLYSSVEDMAQWLVATHQIYQGSTDYLLNRDILDQMFKPVKANYGLGYIINSKSPEKLLISHSGANAGWRSIYVLNPETGDGIVILTNSDEGSGLMFDILNEWFAWIGINQKIQYKENFTMKLMYFFNVLRNIVN